MKTPTLPLRNFMNRAPCRLALVLIPLAFGCFAVSPQARAVCREDCGTYFNTFLGADALVSNVTGNFNTALGFFAGYNTNGNTNIAVGYLGGQYSAGDNNIDIGNQGAIESGVIRIGTQGTQTAAFVAAIRGVAITGAQQ